MSASGKLMESTEERNLLHNTSVHEKAFFEEIRNKSIRYELIIIKLTNLSIIEDLYGTEVVEKILQNIVPYLLNFLDKPNIYIGEKAGIIRIICKLENNFNINKIIFNLHRAIQVYFIQENSNLPLYLKSILSSSDIKDESEIENICNFIEKNLNEVKHDENNYYFPIDKLRKLRNGLKNEMSLANSFQHAVKDRRINLAFQPVIRSDNGQVEYYEALLRIQTDDKRLVSAGPFIPIAEKLGFIDMVDEIVLEMVCDELTKFPKLNLSFNLSNLGTINFDWMRKIENYIKKSPKIAEQMIIEITETAVQYDISKAAYFIASLQGLGCQVALDDFGAGYTSLHQLRSLSIDVIKIDGSYIRDISSHANNKLLVKVMIDISKNLGIETVAEFVENGETAKVLIDMGINYMQGYYFSPALNYKPWIDK